MLFLAKKGNIFQSLHKICRKFVLKCYKSAVRSVKILKIGCTTLYDLEINLLELFPVLPFNSRSSLSQQVNQPSIVKSKVDIGNRNSFLFLLIFNRITQLIFNLFHHFILHQHQLRLFAFFFFRKGFKEVLKLFFSHFHF